MPERNVSVECENCESTFEVQYLEELVSDELPAFCPFCGEQTDNVSEDYIDDDELADENDEWAP